MLQCGHESNPDVMIYIATGHHIKQTSITPYYSRRVIYFYIPKVLNFRLMNDERNQSRKYRNISEDTIPAFMPVQSTAT
jgi:hypothetical protein